MTDNKTMLRRFGSSAMAFTLSLSLMAAPAFAAEAGNVNHIAPVAADRETVDGASAVTEAVTEGKTSPGNGTRRLLLTEHEDGIRDGRRAVISRDRSRCSASKGAVGSANRRSVFRYALRGGKTDTGPVRAEEDTTPTGSGSDAGSGGEAEDGSGEDSDPGDAGESVQRVC